MPAYFIKSGNSYRVSDQSSIEITDRLPVGTYTVKCTPTGEFYLECMETPPLPSKIYGNASQRSERILKTFDRRPATTGVFLVGDKGSGKTLLAKVISSQAAAKGIPTITVNEPWCGSSFNKFIQDISQEAVVNFDEFEKVYEEKEAQNQILTLFDGMYPSKKLFILTVNDKWGVGNYFHNRPGRLFYYYEYGSLEEDFIREYCADRLVDQSKTDTIVRLPTILGKFSFDMLSALIEELNEYNEPVLEALQHLNIRPESDIKESYSIHVSVDGVDIPEEDVGDSTFYGKPLEMKRYGVHWSTPGKKKNDDHEYHNDNIGTHNLVSFDAKEGVYVFRKDKLAVTLRRITTSFDYGRYLDF